MAMPAESVADIFGDLGEHIRAKGKKLREAAAEKANIEAEAAEKVAPNTSIEAKRQQQRRRVSIS